MIRYAHPSDANAIARIYNQAITDGSYATCDLEPVSPESLMEWLHQHQDPYPAFVWEDRSGEVMGWSALDTFSIRPAYLWGMATIHTFYFHIGVELSVAKRLRITRL